MRELEFEESNEEGKNENKKDKKTKINDEISKEIIRSRLKASMDKLALEFSSSLEDDKNIFYYDILVDFAHTLGLYKKGHLTKNDAREIVLGLMKIKDEGFEKLDKGYEDVHEAIEAKLSELTNCAAKMHTARSRNDEVAACLRLYARDRLLAILRAILELRETILRLAKENIDVVFPGFTHLQYAQPTRISHHLLAYHDMLWRDYERAFQTFKRVNKNPLGAAAFASTSFELDRELTASLLGFGGIVENTMDAVASRDFAIETIFVCSSLMLSLSRIAEELILWSSEFNFLELSDAFASSSSIMPQKKNPDIAELIRARAARVCGSLSSAMMIYKAMPFAYNRDFQEVNPLMYFSLESAEICTILASRMLSTLEFKADEMERKASKGFSAATDIADILVQKAGIPFRISHRIVGQLALKGKTNPDLKDLLEAAEKVAEEYVEKIKDKVSKDDLSVEPENLVEKRKNIGSPSKAEVRRMIEERYGKLQIEWEELDSVVESASQSLERLYQELQELIS